MRRFAPPVPRRASVAAFSFAVLALLGLGADNVIAQSRPVVDPNVNMVKGIAFPTGDPYLQRQTEPSIAISTRNPCHLLAGANDYRSVDIPFDSTVPPGAESNLSMGSDAWLGVFKSFDCGAKWQSSLMPGYPQDLSGAALELKGYAAGADPTVRAGTNGLFYYSGMVFNRGNNADSKIFVARFIDSNNKERGDPIEYAGVSVIDTGTKGSFLDKPWLAVDVPRSGYGPGSSLTAGAATCTVKGQQIPAGNAYMAWAKFTGNGDHSKLMFAKSTDCGATWKSHPVSNNQHVSQGASLAIAPHDGTIYLTWREFASNGKPVNMWVTVSSDGGETFSNPKMIAGSVVTFDQPKGTNTFRSNALPTVTADHQDRAYVAWSARGAGFTYAANGTTRVPNNDARIMMVVSKDRGKTWSAPFAIDPSPKRGHQLMPSLAFAAGKIQAIWYDARQDKSGKFYDYIDESQTTGVRHTIDVRGAQASPANVPVFVAGNDESVKVSQYRAGLLPVPQPDGTVVMKSVEVGANAPNIPMYAQATLPFIGDYIDVAGLSAFPVQTTSGQMWQPNIGPINLLGGAAANISTSGFPTLPIFHATWTDNRDVRAPMCVADPANTGERNANIYTARLSPGLFVGSPGNTKPLGTRTKITIIDGKPVAVQELIQRGFVVFAQNSTDVLKFYRFSVLQQPVGGRASFKQFEKPGELQSQVIVSIPKQSTVARTLHVTSTDEKAQILVNVEEMTPIEIVPTTPSNGGVSKEYNWVPAMNGLRGSVLLNPDRTNPKIDQPDLEVEVPQIAKQEVHDPSMFDAQFFRRTTKSRMLDVRNPDPENPDPENPDPENPDPENPDPENPDPENLTVANPDPENPDPENPDPENVSLLNTSISDAEVQSATITDIQWRIHNGGNTTSAYKFRPSLPEKKTNTKYQLIVTRRSLALSTPNGAIDPITGLCLPVYRSSNQVMVNIQNFTPKTPDPENPDPENPDPENPDPENPDPENPDPENPDPENANFFLAPGETATVTLREFDLSGNQAPPVREQFAAKTAAYAANTDQTHVSTAVVGPDLTLSDIAPSVSAEIARPGKPIDVTFTLSNRGTGPAVTSDASTIRTRAYLSSDPVLNIPGDTLLTVNDIEEDSPFAFCSGEINGACSTTTTVSFTSPVNPGSYYVIIVTDPDGKVFEADELNNRAVVPFTVANYQLTFTTQPTSTTQDYTMAPVAVAVSHPDRQPVTAADVAGITLSIANNPAAGTLAGTLFRPTGASLFSDLRVNNVGNGYTLTASAPFSNNGVSAAFNIEADLPPVAINDSFTTNEEAALNVTAPGVLTNDSDPPTTGTKPASYVFDAVKLTDPSNGAVTFNNNGSFAYTPNANFFGADSFTYQARDGRAGNLTTGTVNITVVAVNDVPSFTKGADQSVAEDSIAQTVAAWASSINPGPNEASQVVDFIVTNNNNGLFSVQPAVSANGTLTYTGAANANGVATVTVSIHDNGGVANGGVDTSATQTFTITVTGVNDPPSFTKGADQTVAEDSGAQTIANWATAISRGPADESGQVLTFTVLNPGNPSLFAVQPAISATGTLTYTPAPNAYGTASIQVQLQDDGGGLNLSAPASFNITVTAVNDAPSFTKGADQTATVNTGAQTVAGWATALSAGPNETQTLNFIVSNNNPAIFAVAPAISAAGTLTYTPSAGTAGVATVTVQVHDNGGVAGGGIDTSAAQTFTITVLSAPTTFVVINTNDSGAGSLRQAIINANANASADTITFAIPGAGVKTITPLTALPQILFPVVIDATTQPNFSGSPVVELNGASAGPAGVGFNVYSQNVTIRGFIVNRFQQIGISLTTANNTVVGNYIGTDASGTTALGNFLGVFASVGPNVIGGSTAADRNVISGNTDNGLTIQKYTGPGVSVKGNYIGTNAAGTAAVANAKHGVYLESVSAAQIGGDAAGEGNVISGNARNGVEVFACEWPPACGVLVVGNKIGTNAAGTGAVSNIGTGVFINRSPNTIIRANVISGNGAGVPQSPSNGSGILIVAEDVLVDPQAEINTGNHLIVGNKIGTDVNGLSAVPNTNFGIALFNPTKATIGGPLASDRNVIANSGNNGVHVGYSRSDNNIIRGNYIGVNLGLQPAGNQGAGVFVTNGSSGNTVSGNVIGANIHGVAMDYGQQNANTITGNFIGTDSGGTLNLGNSFHGVTVAGNNNVISQNRIANNGGAGLLVISANQIPGPQSVGNRLSQNAIHNNGALGIDLGNNDGVTANDAGDGDLGPNNLQNFPVISGAFVNGGVATILGSLNSTPSSTYTIEFFSSPAADASGYGEGQNYLGSLVVTTDGSGNAGIATTLSGVTAGSVITATARDAAGNTSEFSQARLAVANNPPTATSDEVLTVSDFAMTTNPAANDVDPDVAAPEVRTTYRPVSGAFGPLVGPGGVAVVASTGRGYFTGGNQAAGTSGKIGILDLTTNAVVGTIPLPGNFGAAFTVVDQATQIVFLRGGINLLAVDGRPTSGTFNQLLLNVNLGTINSWALDSPHHRLYVTTQTTGTGLIASGRITVFDTDPGTATFLQVIAEATVPSLNGTATAIGVNTVTNKLYVSVTGNSPGLYGVDPVTLAMTQIFSSSGLGNLTSVAINDLDNMIYALGSATLHTVDGITNTKLGQVTLSGNGSAGSLDTRLLTHRTSGRVYARMGSFPNPSNLVVVDGKRNSPTINTILTTLNLGRENGTAFMTLDESINRLIATSTADLRSHVIETNGDTIVGSPIMATQTLGRVSLDPTTHRVYLTGGPGYIKVVDLQAAALVTDIHVGTQVFGLAVDPLTHGAYISETGLTTGVKRLNETGISGTIALNHGDGREVYMARNSATNTIYAVNGGATVAGGSDALPGFVHVINGSTNVVTANIAVGPQPFGVAIDEVNNKIYVGNQSNGSSFPGGISIIDGVTNAVVQADVSAIPSVNTPAIISVGRDMVVTTSGRLYFRIISGAATQMLGMLNGTVATPINLGNVNVNIVKYNPVLNQLYVGATPVTGSPNQVFVLNASTNAVVETLTVGSPSSFVVTNQNYIAVNTATGRVFIADFDGSQLVVVDNTNTVVATLPMPFGPSAVAVDDVRNRVYVGNAIARSLTIVDGAALRVVRSLALPIAPARLEVDASLSPARIYALATAVEGAISVIDDPGTAAPQITSVTQGVNGGAVVLNADGSVTYTPATGYVGSDSYSYTTSDGQGGTTTSTTNVTVYAERSIQPATLPNGMVGQNYSQTLTATGGSGSPVVWTVSSGLPPGGLHLSSSGVLSGKLLQAGNFTFTVNARDTAQNLLSETRTYTVNVADTLTMLDLREGVVLETQPAITFVGGNGTRTATVTSGALPPGLQLLSSGSFTGSPTRHGTANFTLELRDCAQSTCGSGIQQQVVTKNIQFRVSAKDQQGSSLTGTATIAFGGSAGRRLAQVFTVGAHGTITAIGVQQLSCPSNSPVQVDLQRLSVNGLPDGTTIATGTATANYSAIAIAPPIEAVIDEKFAYIVSSTSACTFTNPSSTDAYNAGDAYSDTGSGWVPLISTADARYDLPSFRTLMQPAMPVGYLNTSHSGITGVLLAGNQKVLFAGGSGNTSAELYDLATNTSTPTTGAMTVSRANPATVLITGTGDSNVDGTVLLVGGRDTGSNKLSSAETFNPATGLFTPVTGGANSVLSVARDNLRAVMLNNGKVLITGGVNQSSSTVANAELYDPILRTFTTLPNMSMGRQLHVAIKLNSGKVLLAGGYTNGSGSSAELFDPGTSTFSPTNGAMVVTSRGNGAASLLSDGRVLIVGGQSVDVRNEAEIYDPNALSNAFTATGSMSSRRYIQTATPSVGVLVAGGFDQQSVSNYALPLATIERFDPGTSSFVSAGSMETRRQGHTAVVLDAGRTLLAGGSSQSWMSGNTAEIWDPANSLILSPRTVADASPNVAITAAVFNATGGTAPYQIVLGGGVLPPGLTYDSATKTLSGTPTTAGAYTFSLRVTDSASRVGVQAYTMRIGTVHTITSAYRLNDAPLSVPYSMFLASNGQAPVTWSRLPASSLPTGLTLTSSGQITGTPTVTGFYNFGVRAVDAQGAEAIKMHAISVVSSISQLILTTSLAEGVVFETPPSPSISGGNGTRLATITSGALPPGLTLTSSGSFTGSPTRHGTFPFSINVTDCTPSSSCNPGTVQQSVNGSLTLRVSAKDQQGSSGSGISIGFGSAGGRKLAQVFTVGAHGTLTGIGLSNLTCSAAVTVDVQRLSASGLPDGSTIATGTASSNYNNLAIAPPIPVAIGERLAYVVSSPSLCSFTNARSSDDYNGGDAYVNFGSSWQSLRPAELPYDLPSFRTLITPAMPVSYGNNISRNGHTATLLNNGKVLVFSGSNTAVGELYDPATKSMTVTAGAASIVRENATATLLSNGTVLIVGGRDNNGLRTPTAAIFNPITETFSATAGPMANARENHRAVRFVHLGVEKVLITGGLSDGGSAVSSAEIYDPATKTFSPTGAMTTTRESHTATLLQSGKILIVGGFSNSIAAELYDPQTATFVATAGQPAVAFRGQAAAALLGDGRVLITGGSPGGVFTEVLADAVIYDPVSDSFTTTGSMTTRRYAHSATTLPDGSVLIAGGYAEQSIASYVQPLSTLERFIPATNAFVAAGSMATRRQTHTATALADGKVFLVGGSSQSWMTGNTGEIYDPAGALTLNPSTLADAAPMVAISPVAFSAAGGTAPYQIVFAAGVLPPGLTYDQSQATLSGTPTTAGLYTFSLRVTDAASHLDVQTFTMRVGTVNTITTAYRLPDAAQGVSYSTQLAASGQQPITWSVLPASSSLPQGLTLSSAGQITGSPTATGFFTFGVRAVDAQGVQAIKSHAIQVNSALTITTTTVPEGAVLESYTFCLGSSNGTGSTTWSVGNGLPVGVTMQTNGCFTGAPTGLGAFNFTAQVSDSGSPPQAVNRNFSMRVWAREQQGTSSGATAITFGGSGGRKIAQTIVAGANGNLTAFGLTSISCPSTGLVTVEIQGLSADGRPDGVTVASGSTTNGYSGIALSPAVSMTVDRRFAAVITSTTACDVFASTGEFYLPGDGYSGTGNNWTLLKNTDSRYDLPFRTLIEPAVDLTYLRAFRAGHVATLLNNAKVLLLSSGGTTEQVDPSTKTSTITGSTGISRSGFTTTLLGDGTVLVTGGSSFTPPSSFTYSSTAELYDPATGTFTSTGSMSAARQSHAATRLADGRVLITGGFNSSSGTLTSAEIYNPVTHTFTATGNMTLCRSDHRGTLLNSGKVLVAGGFGCGPVNSAEIYDPATGTFTAIAGGTVVPRRGHSATLLPDGRVLLAGGNHITFPDVVNTAELYDPATNTFAATGNLTIARASHAATLMADGTVLLSGGRDNQSAARPLATLERFNPASGTFVGAGNMEVGRSFHTATMIANDQVLIAGGSVGQSWLTGNSAEVYDQATTPWLTTVLPDGQVNVPYPNTTLAAAGGSGAGYQITVAAGTLPPGLSFNSGTQLLSGTPTTAGVYSVVFTVVDSLGHSVRQPVTVRVSSLIITTATLPSATVTNPYSYQLAATGVGGITWTTWSGALPAGLTLSSAGAITGTPTATGFASFTVRAVDSAGQFAVKSLNLNVLGPLVINTTSLGDGTAGNTYYACFGTSNGVGPFTWSLSGQVPIGMAFQQAPSNCLDTSYPARVIRQAGTFNFTVTVTDSSSTPQVASRNYTIRMHGQDQQVGGSYPDPGAIPLPTTRRVAQVLTSATPYDMSGVQLWNISSCTANTQITATVWPVVGVPARPDESGSPLGTATANASSSGFFNSMLTFTSPIPMPQHAQFALVLSFVGGSCSGVNWPTTDWYTRGSGWINDGAGWQPTGSVIGRPDLPLTTLVMPDNGLTFLSTYRSGSASAALSAGRVLLIGNDATAEIYDPVANTLTSTGSMSVARWGATATPLAGGKALIVGGQYWDATNQITVYPTSTEIFDPGANGGIGGFSPGPVLATGRQNHRATRLADGRVLITGGNYMDGVTWQTLQSALLFDSNGSLIGTLNMTGTRSSHSATLMADGHVLVLGGWSGSPYPPTQAEIYDPALGTFTSAGNPLNWHGDHSATLLTTGPRAGQVLIVGGSGSYPDLATTGEFFDPTSLTFSAAPGLRVPRLQHTATTLADGRIAFVGGSTNWNSWTPTSVVEVYDPVSNAVALVGDLLVDRTQQTVNLITGGPNAGKLVVAGGYSSSALAYRTLEVFDAAGTALAITTATLPDGISTITYPGATLQAAGGSGGGYTFTLAWGQLPTGLSLNPNGTVSGTPSAGGPASFVVAVTDSASSTAYKSFTLYVDRLTITSTNPLPNGFEGGFYNFQLAANGVGQITWTLEPGNTLPGNITLSSSGVLSGPTPIATGSYFNVRATDASGQWQIKGFSLQIVTSSGYFQQMGAMSVARSSHVAQQLNSGLVLLAGSDNFLTSAELYSPSSGTSSATGSLSTGRCYGCAAIKLADGNVLAAGGWNGGPVLASAEIYNAATGTWSATLGNMTVNRLGGNVVRLLSDKILILGGHDGSNEHVSANVYDPVAKTFAATGNMAVARTGPAAVRLADGRVLVAGGQTTGHVLTATAEIYDPVSGTFSNTGSMATARQPSGGIRLPDGRVLIAGGWGGASLQTAEVFDPSTALFSAVGSMGTARSGHAMVLLNNGLVLVAGGSDASGNLLSSAELFNPNTNTFSAAPSLAAPRSNAGVVMLSDGRVLLTGGTGIFGRLNTVEIYTP